MRDYYPEIKPFEADSFKVSDLHEIYYERCGNPKGIPLLFVHGGPGAGCHPSQRRYFNPELYHIILVDQRGCGRSKPFLELRDNTTEHLIADFELLRKKLNIERWLLCGGSWGSTLSLAYAEKHPEVILAMILRGIFLAREKDAKWLFSGEGANRIFPDYWQQFLSILAPAERDDPVTNYYKRLMSEDDEVRMQAAKAWSTFECSIASLVYNQAAVKELVDGDMGESLAVLECHYFVNDCFLQPGQLLANIDRIKDIPTMIVHGRYDIVCNLQNAWDLHQVMNKSKLYIVPTAGHFGSEPGIVDRIVQASDDFAAQHQLRN
ncbi:MAG: prolyl aminopeptidase [Gammaproteobacteria bacterium]|nr:prolyl aminopeptidase [Gammaproteobacteria bacterium]